MTGRFVFWMVFNLIMGLAIVLTSTMHILLVMGGINIGIAVVMIALALAYARRYCVR